MLFRNHKNQIKNLKYENKIFKTRMFVATIFVILLLSVLICRLVYLQIYQHNFYKLLSERNQLELLPIEPNRGLIYDRNGILLAENIPVFSLDVILDHVHDFNGTLLALKKIIEITPDNLTQFRKAIHYHRRFEHIPLKLKLTQDEVAIFYLNQYKFPGFVIEAHMIRHYLLGEDMVSALGYVGRINLQDSKTLDPTNYGATNFIGKIGIEKYYEKELHGRVGYKEVEVDASGHVARTIKTIPPVTGDTIYITIDSKLQRIAKEAFGDEKGAVVALNPNNGEVLALVSNPGYDPNLFAHGIDHATYAKLRNSKDNPMFNRAIRGVFPIASTIKPILAIGALDSETITPDFTIQDPGWFQLPNTTHLYRDWQHGGHGRVDVTKSIVESCDIFYYTIAVKLGIRKIDDILTRFGYGNTTGIDIKEETSGIVASPQWKRAHLGMHWFMGDTVISGIGQGYMSATPIQLANAVAAIAKRGKRFQPHILMLKKSPDGITTKMPTVELPPVVLKTEKIWNTIITAMQKVISEKRGTAYQSFGIGYPYTVAGKTGGAQLYHHKIVNENPTPESEESVPKHLRNHKLFIAFAPIDHPKIAIAVVSENCQIAPMVARKVLDAYLNPPH